MASERTAWDAFSIFIRTRDCLASTGRRDVGKCFTCGALKPIQQLDAGHFIKSTHKEIKFHEKNVHAQCQKCNRFEGGQEGVYCIKLVKLYGVEFVDWLMEQKHKPKVRSNDDFESIRQEYKQKLKDLESPLEI